MNTDLFLSLLTAHVLADFYLQNDRMCASKMRLNVRGAALYLHCAIVGAAAWLALFSLSGWLMVLITVISHFVIDALKPVSARMFPKHGLGIFAADQLLHVAVITMLAWIFADFSCVPVEMLPDSVLPVVLAFLVGLKPANIFIKLALKSYDVDVPSAGGDIKNAGALIGCMERIMTIILVMLGEFEAIGFIIAAKSILRFKESDTARTEYVLTGTLLSFGIAMLCGLIPRLFG